MPATKGRQALQAELLFRDTPEPHDTASTWRIGPHRVRIMIECEFGGSSAFSSQRTKATLTAASFAWSTRDGGWRELDTHKYLCKRPPKGHFGEWCGKAHKDGSCSNKDCAAVGKALATLEQQMLQRAAAVLLQEEPARRKSRGTAELRATLRDALSGLDWAVRSASSEDDTTLLVQARDRVRTQLTRLEED